jgi:DNA-binding MarR family transcriptional regulator
MTYAIIVTMSASKASGIEGLRHQGDESHLLREILRTQQALMAGFSRQVGMPASRFALMRSLASAGEHVGVLDLARQLGINASAVTRQVKELEGEGLARRRADPKDGRRSYVRLSPKGLRLFEEIHERSHELERSLFSVISTEEMAAAATVLVKIRTFILGLR